MIKEGDFLSKSCFSAHWQALLLVLVTPDMALESSGPESHFGSYQNKQEEGLLFSKG